MSFYDKGVYMFWENFWPNFLSDLIAGGVIGTLLAWFLGKRLSAVERAQQQTDILRENKQRAIQYLTLLKKEIEDLNQTLPKRLTEFTETGWGREIEIDTPFWDTVDRSGALPQLLHPNMVRYLTQFYGRIAFASRGRDLLIQSWLVPSPKAVPGMGSKQSAFMKMTELGLHDAIDMAPTLIEHVKDNIEVLKEQIKIR